MTKKLKISIESFNVLSCIKQLGISRVLRTSAFIISLISVVLLAGSLYLVPVNDILQFLYSLSSTLLIFPTGLLSITIAVVAIAYGIFSEEILKEVATGSNDSYSVITTRLRYYLIIQVVTVITLYVNLVLNNIALNEKLSLLILINDITKYIWVFWVVFIVIYDLLLTFHLIDFIIKILEGRIEFYRVYYARRSEQDNGENK